MKKMILLVLLVGVFSCSEREIKVPKVAMQGAEEVANHSIIWMFYGVNGRLDVNEKNRISSTNWFFNVDKHLKLYEVIPETNRLLIKHNKKSPHNTEPMNNYFTYVNSLNDHLSFYQIDSINFKIIKKEALPKFQGDTILVDVGISDLQIPTIKDNTIIQAVYNSEMNFQEYLETKALFNKVIKPKNLSTTEYILKNN
jgi:hypothetical protein